jgi:3-oxoacyl-[acyl-carrier-protein] synthase I
MGAVPITAYAVCNALGADTETVVEALAAGRSGLRPDGADGGFVGALGFDPEPVPGAPASADAYGARLAAHVAALVLGSIEAACRRWGPHRVGLLVGSSSGGLAEVERALAHGRVRPRSFCTQATIDVLQHVTGARGPALAIATGCTSSAKAMGSAQRLIESGVMDAAVVVGVDTLVDPLRSLFGRLGVASPRVCRPLCKDRDGLNLGEGAALMLLERNGAAGVALLAVGEANDARDPGALHPDGTGMRAAMRRALEQAEVSATRVGHVNVHASGTRPGDEAEASAVRDVFGDRARVVATKGYTGHMLGAAGVTEVVFAAIGLERGWLPASIGADPIDRELGLQVVSERMRLESDYAMSTSFGIGGRNVAVLLGVRDP